MKIVLPVSSHDLPLLEHKVRVLEHLGGLEEFDIVFSPSASTILDVESAGYEDRLRLIARSVTTINPQYMEMDAWPEGPNRHWALTAYALATTENRDAWFWMEGDCWPVARGWAKALTENHLLSRKPFFGKIVPTPFRDASGRIAHHINGPDFMMMGCAIYPPDMTKAPDFAAMTSGFINGAALTLGVQVQPWDIKMRWFFHKNGWQDTNLIGDRWNTLNYRVEDGTLKCDAGPTTFTGRAHHDTDVTGAVVIHGCKDTSLAELVLSGAISGEGHPPLPANLPPPVQTPSQTPPVTPQTPRVLLSGIMGRPVSEEEATRIVAHLERVSSHDVPSSSQGETFVSWEFGRKVVEAMFPQEEGQGGTVTLTATEPEPITYAPEPSNLPESPKGPEKTEPPWHLIIQAAREALDNGKKSERLGRLSFLLKTSAEELEPLLKANGFTIKGPAKWVSLD